MSENDSRKKYYNKYLKVRFMPIEEYKTMFEYSEDGEPIAYYLTIDDKPLLGYAFCSLKDANTFASFVNNNNNSNWVYGTPRKTYCSIWPDTVDVEETIKELKYCGMDWAYEIDPCVEYFNEI